MLFARFVFALSLTLSGMSAPLSAQESQSPTAAYKQIERDRLAATTPAQMEQIIEGYRGLVEQGHARSAFRLGNIYSRGTLVEPDLDAGIAFYQQSADLGYADAWRYLGAVLLKADRGSEALEAFANAEQNGVTGYELTAAKAHIRRDFGKTSSPRTGIDMLGKLADAGEDAAKLELARALATPETGMVDFARSKEMFEPLAAGGDPTAMEQLARFYRSGIGVKRSYAEANKLYLAAAEAGSDRALLDAADMEIRRGMWGTAKSTLQRAVAQNVSGAEMALASGHIRNSFRGSSDKSEGVRILEQGIQNGEIAPVLTALYLKSEWRRFPMDHTDLMARAQAAADAGNEYAASALINFVRERPDLIPDALNQRAAMIDRYAGTLSPRRLVEEQVYYILDSQRPPQSWQMLEQKLAEYDDISFYHALAAADRADENAFVYVLQKALADQGYYQGARNGRMGNRLLKATLEFCRDKGYYGECAHGPLRGMAVRLISGSLTAARSEVN